MKSDIEKLDEALCTIVAESQMCQKCNMLRAFHGQVVCWFALDCISSNHEYFRYKEEDKKS